MTPLEALDRLRLASASTELARVCEHLGIRLLVVFGSAIHEERLREPEDLDVAVLLAEGADLVDVVNGLLDLVRCDALDVMDLSRAGVVARAAALGVCEPLYEDEPGLFANRQMAALAERMDTAWLRLLDLELMAR
jgi:predicted nucleotidyltransferase